MSDGQVEIDKHVVLGDGCHGVGRAISGERCALVIHRLPESRPVGETLPPTTLGEMPVDVLVEVTNVDAAEVLVKAAEKVRSALKRKARCDGDPGEPDYKAMESILEDLLESGRFPSTRIEHHALEDVFSMRDRIRRALGRVPWITAEWGEPCPECGALPELQTDACCDLNPNDGDPVRCPDCGMRGGTTVDEDGNTYINWEGV